MGEGSVAWASKTTLVSLGGERGGARLRGSLPSALAARRLPARGSALAERVRNLTEAVAETADEVAPEHCTHHPKHHPQEGCLLRALRQGAGCAPLLK